MSKVVSRNQTGSVSAGVRQPLSIVEEEFLRLFTQEHLTLRLAALRRGCSLENARKYRKKLIEKGYMDARYNQVVSEGFSPQPGATNWTLHALEYVVEIIAGQKERVYAAARGKAQGQIACRGSTVLLFDDSIHIKVSQVFESDSPEKCVWRSAEYMEALLRVLEHDLGLVLLKDRRQNIKRVKGEFSHMNDRLALQPGAQELRVYAGDDGKPRVVVDWSPGRIPEIEFPHSQHGQPDATKYDAYLRDLVEKNTLKLSELSGLVYENFVTQQRLAEQVRSVAQALEVSIKMQQRMNPEVVPETFDPKVVNYFG